MAAAVRRMALLYLLFAVVCGALYLFIASPLMGKVTAPADWSRDQNVITRRDSDNGNDKYSSSSSSEHRNNINNNNNNNNNSVDVNSSESDVLHGVPRFTASPQQRSKLLALHKNLNLTSEQAASLCPVTTRTKYVFNNERLCEGQVDILFVVHTAPWHLNARMRLRRTTLNSTFYVPLEVRVLFLLGRPDSKASKGNTTQLQRQLLEEHEVYGDTVQGDFLDTYRNLSLKGVMGLTWVKHFCSQARLVLKQDDDVFIDPFRLRDRYFPVFTTKKRAMFCNLNFQDTMPIMRRGKWKVDDAIFKGLELYPYSYCSGMAVVMTGDIIPSLYQAAHFTPQFWVDDLYLFGILPTVAGDVTLYDIGLGFNTFIMLNASTSIECKLKLGRECHVLIVHALPQAFQKLWEMTVKSNRDPAGDYLNKRLS